MESLGSELAHWTREFPTLKDVVRPGGLSTAMSGVASVLLSVCKLCQERAGVPIDRLKCIKDTALTVGACDLHQKITASLSSAGIGGATTIPQEGRRIPIPHWGRLVDPLGDVRSRR